MEDQLVEKNRASGGSLIIVYVSVLLMLISLAFSFTRWFTSKYLSSDEDYLREYFRELDLENSNTQRRSGTLAIVRDSVRFADVVTLDRSSNLTNNKNKLILNKTPET